MSVEPLLDGILSPISPLLLVQVGINVEQSQDSAAPVHSDSSPLQVSSEQVSGQAEICSLSQARLTSAWKLISSPLLRKPRPSSLATRLSSLISYRGIWNSEASGFRSTSCLLSLVCLSFSLERVVLFNICGCLFFFDIWSDRQKPTREQ